MEPGKAEGTGSQGRDVLSTEGCRQMRRERDGWKSSLWSS